MGAAVGTTALGMDEARKVGMSVAVTARDAPERRAIVSPQGNRSFAELNSAANRLARVLGEQGLGPGG